MHIRLILIALGLLLVQAGRVDTVVLKSGERIEGEVVSQTDTEISVRRAFGSGNINYVTTYKRSEVAKIEPGSAPAAGPALEMPPPSSQPQSESQPLAPIADKPAFLQATLKKWRQGNAPAVGLELSRLIGAASPQELEDLSQQVKGELNLTLAELAADAHWKAATEKGKNHMIHLSYVTAYELPVLVPRIIREYEAAVREEVKAKPPELRKGPVQVRDGARNGAALERSPASEPAAVRDAGAAGANGAEEPGTSAPAGDKAAEESNALTIAKWIEKPSEFEAPRAEAVAFLGHVQYTISLLVERARLDPALKSDKTLRSSVALKRMQLSQLMKAVSTKIASAAAAERTGRPAAAGPAAEPGARPQLRPAQPRTQDRVPLKQGLRDQLNQHQADQLQEPK